MTPISLSITVTLQNLVSGGSAITHLGGAQTQAVGGMWTSTAPDSSGHNTGVPSFMLVAETGKFFASQAPMIEQESTGTLSVIGESVTGTDLIAFTAPLNCGSGFCNNASAGTPLGGNVITQSSMNLNGNVWSYSNVYNQPSSLAAIAGNWTGIGPYSSGQTLNISSSGVVFEQDASSGCTVNGQVSLIDPSYNAYSITVAYSNCIQYSGFNGQTASGLAAIMPPSGNSSSPSLFIGLNLNNSQIGIY